VAQKPSYEELERKFLQLKRKIAEQNHAEVALRESETKYRAMVESFDGLIYVCSQDYRVEFMNERCIERAGYNAVGDFCYTALHGRDSICPWCVNERVFQGETVRWEIQSPKDQRWYYTVNTPIYHANGKISKQALIIDITERKHAEQLLAAEREILAMVTTRRPLQETLDALNLLIERLAPGTLCSILMLDTEGKRLFHESAPSLPREYVQMMDGAEIGPDTLAGGVSWHTALDPFRAAGDSAALFGLRPCWSLPIQDSAGRILGAFILHDRETCHRHPSAVDIDLVTTAAHLAGLAIERERSEVALLESEEKYRSLFENSADAIYFTTREGRLIDVNQAAVDLFGDEKAEMLNMGNIADAYVNPEDRVRFQKTIEKQGFVKGFELKCRRKDGREMDCLLTANVRITDEGTVLGYQGIIRDVTEQRLMAEAVEQSAEKTKLFAYSVTHDLKNPAIGIYGLSRRLCRQYRDVLDEKGRRYCDQILKTAEQIAVLVEHINLYIATKQVPLNIETVQLQEILQMVKDEFSPRLNLQNITWLEPAAVPAIRADRLALLRVLRNLVDNALKYGGDALSEIRIGYHDGGKAHVLSVSDNGAGIWIADSNKFFERFARDPTARGIDGAGLGLAIVREIAEQHGGKVWVESEPEKGATFCLSIAKKL